MDSTTAIYVLVIGLFLVFTGVQTLQLVSASRGADQVSMWADRIKYAAFFAYLVTGVGYMFVKFGWAGAFLPVICWALFLGLGGLMAKIDAHFELSGKPRFQSFLANISIASFVTMALIVSLTGILTVMANS